MRTRANNQQTTHRMSHTSFGKYCRLRALLQCTISMHYFNALQQGLAVHWQHIGSCVPNTSGRDALVESPTTARMPSSPSLEANTPGRRPRQHHGSTTAAPRQHHGSTTAMTTQQHPSVSVLPCRSNKTRYRVMSTNAKR